MNVIGLSGSLRKGSLNTALLVAAQEIARPEMAIRIEDISQIPPFNSDTHQDSLPAPVENLVTRIRAADAVLIATPEYNYSIPGVLKNAIDWISRADNQPFNGKPIGIMGASVGTLGTARAQYHLRQVFIFLNGMVMNRPEVFVGAAHKKLDAEGNLTDQATRDFLATYLTAFQDWTHGVHRMADRQDQALSAAE